MLSEPKSLPKHTGQKDFVCTNNSGILKEQLIRLQKKNVSADSFTGKKFVFIFSC